MWSRRTSLFRIWNPVFGSQVGTYPFHDLDKVQLCRENASQCCEGAPFRVTLYQTQCGALESSNAEDHMAPCNPVGIVPAKIQRMLLQAVEELDAWINPVSGEATAFPVSSAALPSVPEEQAARVSPRAGSDGMREHHDHFLEKCPSPKATWTQLHSAMRKLRLPTPIFIRRSSSLLTSKLFTTTVVTQLLATLRE